MVCSMPLLLMSLVVSYVMCIVLVIESGSSSFELGRLNYVYQNALDKTSFLFGILYDSPRKSIHSLFNFQF